MREVCKGLGESIAKPSARHDNPLEKIAEESNGQLNGERNQVCQAAPRYLYLHTAAVGTCGGDFIAAWIPGISTV